MCRLPMTSNQSSKAFGRLKLAVKVPLATSNNVYQSTPRPRGRIERIWEDLCCYRREGKEAGRREKEDIGFCKD
jgi:hypothetical protein